MSDTMARYWQDRAVLARAMAGALGPLDGAPLNEVPTAEDLAIVAEHAEMRYREAEARAAYQASLERVDERLRKWQAMAARGDAAPSIIYAHDQLLRRRRAEGVRCPLRRLAIDQQIERERDDFDELHPFQWTDFWPEEP